MVSRVASKAMKRHSTYHEGHHTVKDSHKAGILNNCTPKGITEKAWDRLVADIILQIATHVDQAHCLTLSTQRFISRSTCWKQREEDALHMCNGQVRCNDLLARDVH